MVGAEAAPCLVVDVRGAAALSASRARWRTRSSHPVALCSCAWPAAVSPAAGPPTCAGSTTARPAAGPAATTAAAVAYSAATSDAAWVDGHAGWWPWHKPCAAVTQWRWLRPRRMVAYLAWILYFYRYLSGLPTTCLFLTRAPLGRRRGLRQHIRWEDRLRQLPGGYQNVRRARHRLGGHRRDGPSMRVCCTMK